MLTEDYLIRMLNIAIAALLRITGLKKAGDYEDALQLIDFTLEQLVGLRSQLIKQMEDERLYFVLTRGEQIDTRRLEIIAGLFKEEGDIYAAKNRIAESQDDYNRALRYLLEVFFNVPPEERGGMSTQMDTLLNALPLQSMRTDSLWPLAGFYEENGEYQKAETVLLMLVENPEVRTAAIPEVIDFYQRMIDLSAAQISTSGIDPEQARKNLNRWKRQSV
jgi:tetratricopeptide (TPR) repeat protein